MPGARHRGRRHGRRHAGALGERARRVARAALRAAAPVGRRAARHGPAQHPVLSAHERHLLHHPDRTAAYFDHQSYRYQTLLVPGGARPRETYRVVAEFAARFARHEARRRAAALLEAARPARPALVAARSDGEERGDGGADREGRDGAGPYGERPATGPGEAADDEAAYDRVAARYACVFADVRVRRAEWRWLVRHLPAAASWPCSTWAAVRRVCCVRPPADRTRAGDRRLRGDDRRGAGGRAERENCVCARRRRSHLVPDASFDLSCRACRCTTSRGRRDRRGHAPARCRAAGFSASTWWPRRCAPPSCPALRSTRPP